MQKSKIQDMGIKQHQHQNLLTYREQKKFFLNVDEKEQQHSEKLHLQHTKMSFKTVIH